MEYRILGALEVTRDGRPLALGGGRQSALLALLLVERNRTVDADRIVEELWNGDAPATAGKVVQNLVSQLRRLGADDALRTRGHGYELEVPDDELDAARFERRLADGRDALGRGDPAGARDLLGEALALWRGPALAGFADAPWARAEALRLEERRMVALERRIDADLALGRHADVIGELEAAIARDPLREGLRRQLMLALYRSGRQAEALAAFQDARRTLVGELGIEPGPDLTELHAAVLRQDPQLAAPEPRNGESRRRRRAGVLLLAGGAAVTLAALAALLLAGRDGNQGAAATAGGGALVGFDARSGKVTRRIAAGRTPATIAAGGGKLWMVDGEARTVVRIDPTSGKADTLATGATPTDVAVTSGAAWIANGTSRSDSFTIGPAPDAVVRIDPATDLERTTVLPRGGPVQDTVPEARVAAAGDAVWALTSDGSVARIDPATATITHVAHGVRAKAIAAGAAGVWAVDGTGQMVELDQHSGAVRRRVRLPTRAVGGLAVGDDATWVTGWDDGNLYRIGETGAPGAVKVGEGVTDLAVAGRTVWGVSPISGTVVEVDGRSMRVVRSLRIDGEPRSLAVDGGTVWVALTRPADPLSAEVAGVHPLPGSRCEPVLAGNGGRADVLVVSDLPLQGDTRLSSVQMAQAITFVLREHRFRAGRFRIAYQSCDDAVASSGIYDDAKCVANGRAYAQDRDVAGVIGTFHSGCTERMLPELNRAAGGPVPMVSPLNTYVGLTRPAEKPGLLSTFYPTGQRNFVRVIPPDDVQAGALARLAHDRGDRRAFVLDNGEGGYSVLVARAFTTAARRLGITVAGSGRWDPEAPSFPRLVDRVAAARPDAVLIAGFADDATGRLIRLLRHRLGPDVDLMGPDGLGPAPLLMHVAGPAAKGVFIGYTGVPVPDLPPAGARFFARFARTQSGVEIEPTAIYAAEATEVMLDAIARSDGTRGSVLRQLFRTRLRGSLVGDVSFDPNGDAEQARVTVLRVVGGGSTAGSFASTQGTAVERVDTVSPALIGR
jgi:DNA-binding SARP family transcriptional activator/ABC-type branched-subunit amino acid transport system substrate-binding protein